ncbi:hypothetical protein TrispH2_004944 [Trichoplax sp. H2]|nr:hypothetical protein TrispH2_004944 [Trichoplax sp. H2]|eukprot:RDD42644.1 hypothetical protein TrispH2_004944 [Trichoplax sp. H2]
MEKRTLTTLAKPSQYIENNLISTKSIILAILERLKLLDLRITLQFAILNSVIMAYKLALWCLVAIICFHQHCHGASKTCLPVTHIFRHREKIGDDTCSGSVVVQSCAGYCSSASFPSIDPPFYRPVVRCCQSINTTTVPLQLKCGSNGFKKIIRATYHVQCACQGDS